MVLPKGLTGFNRDVTNRITKPFAKRLGGFAVIEHRGRRSGAEYSTPVNAWSSGNELVVALTYGDDVDWLKNVDAAGEARLVIKGKGFAVRAPQRLDRDSGLKLVPRWVGAILKALDVTKFVRFEVTAPR